MRTKKVSHVEKRFTEERLYLHGFSSGCLGVKNFCLDFVELWATWEQTEIVCSDCDAPRGLKKTSKFQD